MTNYIERHVARVGERTAYSAGRGIHYASRPAISAGNHTLRLLERTTERALDRIEDHFTRQEPMSQEELGLLMNQVNILRTRAQFQRGIGFARANTLRRLNHSASVLVRETIKAQQYNAERAGLDYEWAATQATGRRASSR